MAGCRHVRYTSSYRFADQVKDITQDHGAEIVYDGLGQQAFNEHFEALAMCGHWVSFGQASGAQNLIAPELLSPKSITLTRPVLFHYTAQREKLNAIAARTFDAVKQGILKVPIHHRYPLSAAAQAHSDLEARATTGAVILLP